MANLGDNARWMAKVTPRKPRRGFWDGPIVRPVVTDEGRGAQTVVDDEGKTVVEHLDLTPLENA